ncbi:MAG: hypothetical protein ACRESZ_06615 [Methylococcales bacterium]
MNDSQNPIQTVSSNTRLLTAEDFRRLSDVPPEVEWFANLTNKCTRRAYENAIQDFMVFAGIQVLEEFRDVTRAHVIPGVTTWCDASAAAGP